MLSDQRQQWLQRTDGGPILRLDMALTNPWHVCAAWSVLAGALASGADLLQPAALLRLAGALVLADGAWGVLWRWASEASPTSAESAELERVILRSGLPYWQQGSPLANVLAWTQRRSRAVNAGGASRVLGAGALVCALVITGLLSVLLGGSASVLSAAALVVCGIAVLVRWRGRRPHLLSAILDVGLAWFLGAVVLQDRKLASLIQEFSWQSAVVVGTLVVLVWGFRRRHAGTAACGVYWIGLALVIGALALAGQPLLIAGVAPLLALPAWGCARRSVSVTLEGQIMRSRQENAFLLLALIVVALGMR